MELDQIWDEYGLSSLENGINALLPRRTFSLERVLLKLMDGRVLEAVKELFLGSLEDIKVQTKSIRQIIIWVLVLGILSAFITRFMEVFEKKQLADLGYYFIFLLLSTILLRCFYYQGQVAKEALEKILFFNKVLIPAYMLAIGLSTGVSTATFGYQIFLLSTYGVEKVFRNFLYPLIRCFCLFVVMNGIWRGDRLNYLMELLQKGIGWILKASVSVVLGIGIVQRLITPIVDGMSKSVMRKVIAVVPGVGDAAEGVMDMMIGSATVIKNSMGVVLLVLLIVVCLVPLIQILLTSVLLKVSAALVGIVSDKKISYCTDQMGEAGLLLFRLLATAMFLFFISIAVMAGAMVR